jgi:hypothetical protein
VIGYVFRLRLLIALFHLIAEFVQPFRHIVFVTIHLILLNVDVGLSRIDLRLSESLVTDAISSPIVDWQSLRR